MSLYEVLKASKAQRFPDYWTLLWGRKLSASMIKTLTGTLPLTFTAKGGIVADWTISGNAEGVGQRTANKMPSPANGTYTSNRTTVTVTDGVYHIVQTEGSGSSSVYIDLPEFDVPDSGYINYLNSMAFDNAAVVLRYNGASLSGGYALTPINRAVAIGSDYAGKKVNQIQIYTTGNAAMDFTMSPMITDSDTYTSYIPYGYEIPLTISQTGQPDKTYDIYIGDSKLGAEEYADYESGKVYKRTAQLIPRFMPQKKESEHLSIECSLDEITVTILPGASADETLYLDVTPFDIPISVGNGGTGVLVAFVQSLENTRTYITLRNGSTNLIDYGYLISSANLVKDNYIFRTQKQTCNRIYFTLSASASPTPQTFSIKLCLTDDGQTPVQYIPYCNPTDPPIALPAIETFKGTNTIDSTETLGEVTIKGQIKPQS